MSKKLLYVINALAIHGGLERVTTDKVNWLASHSEFEVFVLTFDQGDHPLVYPLRPKVVHEDLSIQFHQQYYYSGLKRWLFVFRLHQLFRKRLKQRIEEIKPDIIICPQKRFLPDVDKASSNIPVILECHCARQDSRFENHGVLRRLLNSSYEWPAKHVSKIIALTQGDADEWRKVTSRVCVIPNVVHLNESDCYSDNLSKSAIFVGRYSTQKDIGSLIRVWQIVNRRYPDWKLHIYGGYGDQSDIWPQHLSQMDINVIVHEPTSSIFDKYLDSSMLLLTSLYEPFGLVLPEAMSCGLPVVSFDCPYGPSDIISDGIDGFLVKDRNVEVFAERVCMLIEDESLRQRMGKAAIASSQRYRSDLIMPEWIKLFREILNNG